MPFEVFAATNAVALAPELKAIDPASSLSTVASTRSMGFTYKDPKGRFKLSFPAIGTPANTTRFMISRGTRLGLATPAVKHIEFTLSDAADLRSRIVQATKIDDYLRTHGFRPASYNRFQYRLGSKLLTNYRELLPNAETVHIERIGGAHLVTLQRDELIVDMSLIHQLYSLDGNDYTLYFIIREKVLGVED